MKLHEFQAKRLFGDYGMPVPKSFVVSTPQQAKQAYGAAKQFAKGGKGFRANVKVQIHAGGRGKAGGVLVASSPQEAAEKAKALIGRRMVTYQTGAEGLPVKRVLIDERIDASRELYLAVTVDRSAGKPVLLASARGGVDIEAVAKDDPNALIREVLDPLTGVLPFHIRRLQNALDIPDALAKSFAATVSGAYRCFVGLDATIVEINPLVITPAGRLLVLDAKLVLDDNALFRHPELAKLRDKSQEHPIEANASEIGISYVGLDGNIGCLVNGAGLAMATNDIIKLYGGNPANFLDVGGGANVEQVTKAFQIILSDKRVKAILVNIFGGIMRCDWIAEGLLKATAQLKVKVPIVVRLEGTNVNEGRALLQQAKGLSLITADDLASAAQRVVALAK